MNRSFDRGPAGPRGARSRSSQVVLAAAAAALAAGTGGTCAFAENPLEEVIISSSRVPMPLREVGTSVSVLGANDILQRGFLSLPELLRTQPSISVSNNGGVGKSTSLRIRGEEGYRTMVLLDGIDIADTSSPQVSPRLEHIMSNGVERVEILRGPQGLSYGADAGGVINIRTATPTEGLDGRVSAEAGRYGTEQYSGQLGGRFDDVDFVVTAASFASDGFNTQRSDTELRDDDGYENTTLHARTGWDVNDALRLEAVLRSVDGDNQFDGCFNAAFSPTNDCADEFRQDSWRLAADLETGNFSHQLSYTDNRTDREFFAEGDTFFAAEGEQERVSYLGRWQNSDALTLVYGVDHESESIDDGTFDRSRDQTGLFAEYQGRFSDGLTITAGVRNDDNDDFGNYTSYRLSTAWVRRLQGGELKLKGVYGTGFRAPSLYEISYNRGPFARPPAAGAELNEETSAGYDLGVVFASDSGSYLELTWFEQEIDDLIVFDPVGFSGYLQAPGRSDSRGVELVADIPLPLGLRLGGNFTWNETTDEAGQQRAFRPERMANLGLNYTDEQQRIRAGINLRSSARAVDLSGAGIDDYLLMDVNASYQFSAGLTVYARLENALDENYQEFPGFRAAGQSLFAGARYEF